MNIRSILRPLFPVLVLAFSQRAMGQAADHILKLNTGDDDAAINAWAAEINRDCSDHVLARIPAGSVTIRRHPFIDIKSACQNPHREVEIAGSGIDATTIRVTSSAPNGGGGFVFMISDPRVHVHDMTLIGNGDVVAKDDGSGAASQGIKFQFPTAGFGEADRLRIANFTNAGIDIYQAPGVTVHDVVVDCTPGGSAARQPAMGIWVRGLQDTPGDTPNATITNNRVINCGAEGITMGSVRGVRVLDNTVSCPAGHCVIGIALYSTARPACTSTPISDNVVARNVVDGAGRIQIGIIMEGTGSGHNNQIDSNTVRNPIQHGIQIAGTNCGPGSRSAFSDNRIVGNDVSSAGDTQIWNGGAHTVVEGNRTHVDNAGQHAIADPSGSALVRDNTPY